MVTGRLINYVSKLGSVVTELRIIASHKFLLSVVTDGVSSEFAMSPRWRGGGHSSRGSGVQPRWTVAVCKTQHS